MLDYQRHDCDTFSKSLNSTAALKSLSSDCCHIFFVADCHQQLHWVSQSLSLRLKLVLRLNSSWSL